MLNSVGERTPPLWNASFKLTLSGCVVSICCVGFASIYVVCDELNDCAWNELFVYDQRNMTELTVVRFRKLRHLSSM